MQKIVKVILACALIMLSIAFQPSSIVDAQTTTCPTQGCKAFLPLITNGAAPVNPMHLCLVTDTGGINDHSFNAAAWQAHLDAKNNLGATIAYRESQQVSDYATNIEAFTNENCDLITTVGFMLADPTLAAAQAHPNQKFTIADVSYDPILNNVSGQVFAVEQAAFLSGYMAAGKTVTGKVGTFGGFPIPVVTAFMNGYAEGVDYYNTQHGTSVQVIGWDTTTRTGLFTYSFDDQAAGYALANQLLTTDGADIIFPVAGVVGLGAAQAVQEHGNSWLIGVDSDWTITNPDYASIILTSVMKNIRATTYGVILNVKNGIFVGGNFIGNLVNQGVGLGAVASSVSPALLAEIELVKTGIISGAITAHP